MQARILCLTQDAPRGAWQLIERMRQKRIALGPYLDQGMVDRIYQAMDIPITRESDGIDEDIADDM